MSLQVDPRDGPQLSRGTVTRSGNYHNVNHRHYLCCRLCISCRTLHREALSHSILKTSWRMSNRYSLFVLYCGPMFMSFLCVPFFTWNAWGTRLRGWARLGDHLSQLANVEVGNMVLDLGKEMCTLIHYSLHYNASRVLRIILEGQFLSYLLPNLYLFC